MTSQPVIHSRFSVTSGSLCYGTLHNIWHGASSPEVQGIPVAPPHPSGTVIRHELQYKVSATNGTWSTFQLVDLHTHAVSAWFVSHSEVDPEAEVDNLLRVSGSPYERDCGSSTNSAETSAQGVLVINRYDWGGFDYRGLDAVGEIDGPFPSVGLVDSELAETQVLEWKGQAASERNQPPVGAWLYIPETEYIFGRFGFDEMCTAARSFLIFTGRTTFTRTAFVGLHQPLRREESHEERFHRRLREGYNFQGLDVLQGMASSSATEYPSESEALGPFDENERLLESTDFDSLRVKVGAVDFIDPWKEPVYALLNEMVMSYLVRFVVPATSCDSVLAAANTLSPNRTSPRTLGFHMYSRLTEPRDPIPGFDSAAVESRIKSFLLLRCVNNGLASGDEFVAVICRSVVFLVSEVLEVASFCSKDSYRGKILPVDIRISVHNDAELLAVFKFCKLFWYGP